MKATLDIPPQTQSRRDSSVWQQWLHHPDRLGARKVLFQAHLWLGTIFGLYIFVMSLSGSVIVNRRFLEGSGNPHLTLVRIIEWLVNLHENLLLGQTGRLINGFGALALGLLCITGVVLWWPGIRHWRRNLTVSWRSSFARINWDLHNALGIWLVAFVAIWVVSGVYFAFPDAFNWFGDTALIWLSNLHFGRFGWFTEGIWTVLGLVPAVLAFTGVFMCCHRLLTHKSMRSSPGLPRL